ncbi:MAG: DUF2794 domain-containing protein [Salinarimonas sp.]
MSDGETAQPKRGGTVVSFPAAQAQDARVSFDRDELRTILNVYGRKVAAGEWRDYAIDFRKDKAIFAVFRRASEMPLYRIEKDPRLARRQGAYAVVAASGLVMKRGQELGRVLNVLEGKQLRVVE